jgi:hypothetical protein
MNDFADWLSPILVKELRQGMRSRAFVGIFLIVQAFMVLCVLTSMGSDGYSGSTEFFWTISGITLLGIMPLRGIATLNGEIKGNTIELLLLTRLSAWRITAGKWTALFLQTLLLVSAVLPYLILRYFLGGVNLVNELATLAWMLCGSALLTALAVGFSAFMNTVVGRLGLGAVGFFAFYGTAAFLSRMRFTTYGPTMSDPKFWITMAAILGPLLILQCFELGLTKIAPIAENHSSRKRLLAMAIVTAAAVIGWKFNAREGLAIFAGSCMLPICLGALSEEVVPFPSIYRGFVRRGFLGRVLGRLLYPGWPAGLLFSLLLYSVLLYVGNTKPSPEATFYTIAGLGTAIFPFAIIRVFSKKRHTAIGVYASIQAFGLALATILSIMLKYDQHPIWPAFLPTSALFLQCFSSNQHSVMEMYTVICGVVTLISLVVILLRSIPEWITISKLEKEAMLAE